MGRQPGDPDIPAVADLLSLEGDFHFYSSPWVSGTRCKQYYGPVVGGAKVDSVEDVIPALEECMVKVAAHALSLGATCLVGMEIQIEILPGGGYKVDITGTGAALEWLGGNW